jgi:signal peptidase I
MENSMSKRRRRKAAPTQPAPKPRTLEVAQRRIREILMSVLPVIAIATVTRVALAETYHIPSGSMEPTLLVGDRLLVNKLRYGPHIPFTRVNLPGYAAPRRGDVAVFVSPPQDPSIRIAPDEVTPMLVKRIVGVAGDTLAMRSGQLYVNGIAERSPVAVSAAPPGLVSESLPIFDWQHRIATTTRMGRAPAHPTMHEWGPLVVPADSYFMMGDNRDDSVDSRFYGPVPRRNLRGRPMFVYYSYERDAGLAYLRALTAIRWQRLGTWIE